MTKRRSVFANRKPEPIRKVKFRRCPKCAAKMKGESKVCTAKHHDMPRPPFSIYEVAA